MTQLSPPEAARLAIENSGLGKTTIANALALLARAHPYNGHITLTWDSLLDLFSLQNRRSAARHLTHIARSGIIHYSTNAQVFVTFLAWTPLRVGAQNLRVGAQNLRVGAQSGDDETARGRAGLRVGAQNLRVGAQSESAIKGMSECVSILTPIPEKNSHTHPLPDGDPQRSHAILTDPAIGVTSPTALAEAVHLRPFAEIRAICCDLFAEGREDGSYAGLVISRIRTAASIPPQRHNELYQRHRTPEEIAAEEAERVESERIRREFEEERERRNAETERRRAEQEQARSEMAAQRAGDTDAVWEWVRDELRATIPAATFDTWLSGATGAVADGVLTVTAANAHARDWLHNRLAVQIRRLASRHAGRSLELEIVS
jgi:hypothetical protein